MHNSQFALLWKRRFLPIFSTQFFGALTDSVFKNALVIFIVYGLTYQVSSSTIMSVAAQAMLIIPFFIFSAIAGQLADKFDKSKYIILIKSFEIILMLIAAYAFSIQNIGLLFVALFLSGTQSAFFGPVKYSILPQHLKKGELISGNALVEASTFLAILLGVIIGTEATNWGTLVIAGLMISFSVIGLVSACYIPSAPSVSPNLKINFNLLKESLDIINETKRHPSVYHSILGISWFWVIGAIFLAQFPTFTRDTLGAAPSVVQLFLCTFSIGIAAGSLICNLLLKGQINAKYVPLGVLGMTVFIFDMSISASHAVNVTGASVGILEFLHHSKHWRILFDMFALSTCGGIFVVPLYALMQHDSPEEFRSRAIACNNIINAIFMTSASIITIALLYLGLSITKIFFLVGIVNALVAVYTCKLLPEALVKSFIKWALQAIYQAKIHGMEHYINAGDRVLMIANHTSYLDVVLLSAFLPHRLTYVINTDVAKKWWIQPFLALVETFPIDPTNPMTAKSIIKRVRAGQRIVIFPEGRITTTGTVMKVYEGPGLIAQKAGAKLLPIRIEGAQYTIFSRLRGKVNIRLFPKISLTILKPREFQTPKNILTRDSRRVLATELYKLMTEMIFESSDYQQTLFSALLDARRQFGGRSDAVEDINRKTMSYNQVIARCFILGKPLSNLIEYQERVGVMLPTSAAAMICFFGLQAYGRVPAMLNFSSGFYNIHSACKVGMVKTIITAKRFVEAAKLEEIIGKLLQNGFKVVYLEDIGEGISIFSKLLGLVYGRFARLKYKAVENTLKANDAAVVLFTSGSEGDPKGVLLSHANLLANCYQMNARVDFTQSDIMFNAMPIFHSFGLTVGAILPMIAGIKVFFYPTPLHYRIVPELIYDINATIMFGTDTFLNGYSKFAHPYDFYSVRYIFAGAEKLKPETRNLFMDKFGVRVFEGYGATETAPVLSTNTPMLNKSGSVGCLMPCLKAKLEPVPGIQGAGRLFVKGPNVMLGYLRMDNPGVVDVPEDGWYDTGDIVSIDDDGFLTIEGRAKRFSKIAGEMISLTAVELHATKIWPEFLHAVVSVPDTKKGEALILLTNNQNATREEFSKYAKHLGISELYVPKSFIVTKEIPVLATGKIDYLGVEAYALESLNSTEMV